MKRRQMQNEKKKKNKNTAENISKNTVTHSWIAQLTTWAQNAVWKYIELRNDEEKKIQVKL